MLHRTDRQRVVKLILLLTLVALALMGATPALAKATTVTTNITFTFDVVLDGGFACGEDIHLSGPLKALFHVTLDGGGGFHSNDLFNPKGITGVGLTSGATYQATGETRFDFNGKVGSETTFVNNFKIIGHGLAENFLVHNTFHVTVRPDGTVTAFVDNFSVECR